MTCLHLSTAYDGVCLDCGAKTHERCRACGWSGALGDLHECPPKRISVVLVCGGRHYQDRATVFGALDTMHATRGPIERLIEGGATGADALASEWAKTRGISRVTYRAEWSRGRKAGPERNARMLAEGKPDACVAFSGGRGTADMTRRARAAGVEVIEVGGEKP